MNGDGSWELIIVICLRESRVEIGTIRFLYGSMLDHVLFFVFAFDWL